MDPIIATLIITALLLVWLIPNDVWSFAFYLLTLGIVGTVFYWTFLYWISTWG